MRSHTTVVENPKTGADMKNDTDAIGEVMTSFVNSWKRELVVYTEKEILDMYWDYWYAQMVRKYGQGHYLITEQNCIDDWAVTHYAKEIK